VPEGDFTNGHIDAIACFIGSTTVAVPDCTAGSKCLPGNGGDDAVYDAATAKIKSAGYNVIRDPIMSTARYRGYTFNTNYMNWIGGTGFVIAVVFGNPEADTDTKLRIESYFPKRDFYIIEMLSSWFAGGGVHFHTNSQPAK